MGWPSRRGGRSKSKWEIDRVSLDSVSGERPALDQSSDAAGHRAALELVGLAGDVRGSSVGLNRPAHHDSAPRAGVSLLLVPHAAAAGSFVGNDDRHDSVLADRLPTF